jgi:glycosyltransferase involved in cell wall biosynthesis
VTDADVVVLSAARHEPAKALDVLVAALASARAAVPGICLVIAGSEGGATASVRAVVDAHGLSSVVSLLGPRDDIADLLCAADVFALSSRREGMPGAVIEAAALEAPIVATDLPAVREITGLDGALLVAPDPASLADALVAVVRDPDAARQRAVQARTRFEAHFTTARTAGAMRDFYERALGREGPAGGSPARVATTT